MVKTRRRPGPKSSKLESEDEAEDVEEKARSKRKTVSRADESVSSDEPAEAPRSSRGKKSARDSKSKEPKKKMRSEQKSDSESDSGDNVESKSTGGDKQDSEPEKDAFDLMREKAVPTEEGPIGSSVAAKPAAEVNGSKAAESDASSEDEIPAIKKRPGKSTRKSLNKISTSESDDENPLKAADTDEQEPSNPLSTQTEEDEDKAEDDESEPSKPVLRLVPLTQLLKPEVLDKPAKSGKPLRKSKKNTSYIEISSDSGESAEVISSSDDEAPRRKAKKVNGDGSSKENSTNNKLKNGNSTKDVVKELQISLAKMPNNINKLMTCYKVDTECWTETDDFENMISTTKIDRNAPDKTNEVAKSATVEESQTKNKREKQKKKGSNDDSDDLLIEVSSPEPLKRTGRISARSARERARRVQANENDSNDSEDEPVTMKAKKSKKVKESSSDGSEKPLAKKAQTNSKKSKAEPSESSSEEKKLFKNKKALRKDDHRQEKTAKIQRVKSTSSEEEKAVPTRGTRSRKAKETEAAKTTKPKKGDKGTRSSSRSRKAQDLKLKINFSRGDGSDESVNDEPSSKTTSDTEQFPIIEEKFRKRNKYESHSAFQSLKAKIEERRTKRKASTEDEAVSRQNGNDSNEKSETNNNGDVDQTDEDDDSESIAKAKKTAANRKRLISTSEEEQKNSDSKTPAKKTKMETAEDSSDYEAPSGEDEDDKAKSDEDNNSKSESENSDDDDEGRKKRKAAKSSDYSENDSDEKSRPKQKRLKRIKKVASSDEEDENGEKSKGGRKNIRKMIKVDKLDVSTKEAGKIERERKQRIEERQKMYNQIYDERPEEAKEISKLVLDFDEETKKPLLQVDKKLARKLKPHQANGVKFMWDACFESLDRCNKDLGSGCILAHCMGLGKTLQVVTLVHTLLKNTNKTSVTRVLVVCPLSTVLNWVNEFNIWLKDIDGMEDIYVYEINKLKQNTDRANKLMEWHNDGGIMILSYDMFRNLSNDTGSRLKKKVKESLQTTLVDPGPDLVICDEGHLLKNEKTSISKAMMKLRTLRRIVLTGTPLQNNLKEYYCMVQFVKPNLLGKYQEYLNRFVNPITNGQYIDSTEYDIKVMRRRAHVLHKMLDGCVQRRDYAVLAPFLPPKHEYVMSIKLTPMQVKLYKFYMQNKSRSNDENGGRKGSILFQDFQNLQRIWTAPLVLRYNSNRYEMEMQKRKDQESEDESEGSLKDFIDDSESAKSTSSSSCDDDSDEDATSIHSDDPKKGKKKKKKQKNVPLPRRTRAKAADFPSDHEAEENAEASKKENPTEWWMQICPEEELNNLEHSSKLMLLMSILEECEAIGDKLLVFSQSLYSLDVIEHFLNHIDEQTQNNSSHASFTGSWSLGQDYYRLDGSTPVEQRNAACKHFNSASNPRARLFLISTRAGGLGINLVAANRVVIFDVSWNPSHDIQSIFRVYRFGQKKPCYIYRFLALGTMEEKIYERQVTKQAISKRVIDEQQIDRHYNQNDLSELYRYDLEPDDERILPILPKDRLFANMLSKFENVIYKYHEHDTLLENKEEETLDEEERKQAWEEFEAEKNRPQFVPNYVQQQQLQPRGVGPVTSNNLFGIRTDVLLKLLSMKARLDNPHLTDLDVKQAIPILMQELYKQMERGELTLYQQLIALSSSLEVPQNYGGQFRVNENMMQQTYNSMHQPLPSTSSFGSSTSMLQNQLIADRQQQLLRYQQQQRTQMIAQQLRRNKSPPRVVGNVIEID